MKMILKKKKTVRANIKVVLWENDAENTYFASYLANEL